MASRKRRTAIRLAIPGLIVTVLTFVALWRIGAPAPSAQGGPGAQPRPAPLPPPITEPSDVLAAGAIGRLAELENVTIRDLPSVRTLRLDTGGGAPVFAVLDPDVKRSHEARLIPGARVTVVGLVRRSPAVDVIVRQWGINAATARMVEQTGTYLYVTEIKPGI